MLELFCPDLYISSLSAVDLKKLYHDGIRGLIVDLDNTLVAWEKEFPAPEAVEWLDAVEKQRLETCILSNSPGRRVSRLSEELGVPAVSKAIKPRKRAFREAICILDLPPNQCAVIGDQLLTDILGGNRMGLYTILVVPVSEKEFFTTRIVRRLERFILTRLKRRDLIGEPNSGTGCR